jgi:hypothetical protein
MRKFIMVFSVCYLFLQLIGFVDIASCEPFKLVPGDATAGDAFGTLYP